MSSMTAWLQPASPVASPAEQQIDYREQPYNGGAVGPVETVSTARDLITRLSCIVVDLDPKYIRPELLTGPGTTAEQLFRLVAAWLERHPLGHAAEVRSTGSGLHVLFRIEPAVEFETTEERDLWDAVVKLVQASLPSDPNAPAITILTRPVGSTNGKTGRTVNRLRESGVAPKEEVLAFVAGLAGRPFAVLAGILHGEGERLAPCPVCNAAGSSMAVLNKKGMCYGCGNVSVARLYATVMAEPTGGVTDASA
jgi:hypothetical protein